MATTDRQDATTRVPDQGLDVVSERSFARLSKEPSTPARTCSIGCKPGEAMIDLATIRLMLNRIGPHPTPACHRPRRAEKILALP